MDGRCPRSVVMCSSSSGRLATLLGFWSIIAHHMLHVCAYDCHTGQTCTPELSTFDFIEAK